MARTNALSVESLLEAVEVTRGYTTAMAEYLGCSVKTIYNYIAKYPEVKQALEDVRNVRHEFVKSKLFEKIEEGNLTAIIFYLKSQCGWYDRPIVQLPARWKDFDPEKATDKELAEFIKDVSSQ